MSERVRHRVDSADWSAVPHPHVIELVRQGCAEDPERPAIILEDGLIVTRRALLDRSQRFAGYLGSRLKPGDRVVVMLDNRVEFMIALFAIMANRAILVSIAPTAQQHDAGHILADSEPVLAICGAAQKPVLEQLRPGSPSLRELLVVEGEEPAGLADFERAAEIARLRASLSAASGHMLYWLEPARSEAPNPNVPVSAYATSHRPGGSDEDAVCGRIKHPGAIRCRPG